MTPPLPTPKSKWNFMVTPRVTLQKYMFEKMYERSCSFIDFMYVCRALF